MTGIIVEWWATVSWSHNDADGETRSYADTRRFGREEDASRWLSGFEPPRPVESVDRLGPWRRTRPAKKEGE